MTTTFVIVWKSSTFLGACLGCTITLNRNIQEIINLMRVICNYTIDEIDIIFISIDGNRRRWNMESLHLSKNMFVLYLNDISLP